MDKDAKNDVVAPSSKRARDNSVARSAVSKRRRRRAGDGGNQDKPLASLAGQQLAGGTVDRPRQVPRLGLTRAQGERAVDKQLAKVVRVARAREHRVVDQMARLQFERKVLLCVADVQMKEAEDEEDER